MGGVCHSGAQVVKEWLPLRLRPPPRRRTFVVATVVRRARQPARLREPPAHRPQRRDHRRTIPVRQAKLRDHLGLAARRRRLTQSALASPTTPDQANLGSRPKPQAAVPPEEPGVHAPRIPYLGWCSSNVSQRYTHMCQTRHRTHSSDVTNRRTSPCQMALSGRPAHFRGGDSAHRKHATGIVVRLMDRGRRLRWHTHWQCGAGGRRRDAYLARVSLSLGCA